MLWSEIRAYLCNQGGGTFTTASWDPLQLDRSNGHHTPTKKKTHTQGLYPSLRLGHDRALQSLSPSPLGARFEGKPRVEMYPKWMYKFRLRPTSLRYVPRAGPLVLLHLPFHDFNIPVCSPLGPLWGLLSLPCKMCVRLQETLYGSVWKKRMLWTSTLIRILH